MRSLVNPQDPVQMNWLGDSVEWGTVKAVDGLLISKGKKLGNNIIKEQYEFTNQTDRELFLREGDVAIYTPFQDNYDTSPECMTNRCHTHVWCGGEVAYVCALRMGGAGFHMGLCLTKGSIRSYSYERDLSKGNNDRGILILNVTPKVLAPGESIRIEWVIFWHKGKQDFYKKLENFSNYVRVEAERYVLFENEQFHLRIKSMTEVESRDVRIEKFYKPHESINKGAVLTAVGDCSFHIKDGIISVDETLEQAGEYLYQIKAGEVHTFCRAFVSPSLKELVRKRCHFLVANQQYHRADSHLDGAFLVFDNEAMDTFYQAKNEFNAGRERIGMGILLARFLQEEMDEEFARCLSEYVKYVTRELVDTSTGEVFNDAGRDNSRQSLYNAPWVARFFMEVYKFSGNKEFLKLTVRILDWYYSQNGARLYAYGLPMSELIECLEKEQMHPDSLRFLKYFMEHAEYLLENGTTYPAKEANYEQSVVAAAAGDLLEVYALTGEEKYLDAAEEHLALLELFVAKQPDYRMNECAIRHWDDFVYGKQQMYGDNYPNYRSALSGIAYLKYSRILKHMEEPSLDLTIRQFARKAFASMRGPLSLFFEDGSASCAYVYPYMVNDRCGEFYDGYANDQDWALYFLLQYQE